MQNVRFWLLLRRIRGSFILSPALRAQEKNKFMGARRCVMCNVRDFQQLRSDPWIFVRGRRIE